MIVVSFYYSDIEGTLVYKHKYYAPGAKVPHSIIVKEDGVVYTAWRLPLPLAKHLLAY
jgi:hypothetical protein